MTAAMKGNASKAAPAIKYARIDDLFLDPKNPRLGRNLASPRLSQEKIMAVMRSWSPEELAISFVESGFWPQEAVVVVRERLYGSEKLVVVEGNRRIAALKFLKQAHEGAPVSPVWQGFVEGLEPGSLFDQVPYIEVGSRKELSAFLGYRHVTGIKEWKPAEKAEYIAHLIEEEKLSYEDVRRKIGSKAPAVRHHYIAFSLLRQMEKSEDIDVESVEQKFSVLYLSLRTNGVREYLGIDADAAPSQAKSPVSQANMKRLANYARWLFGDKKHPPLFTDSRFVDSFGDVLESEDAVDYLERTESPRFDVALRKSGAGERGLVDFIERATDNVQQALTEAHVFKKSAEVGRVVERFTKDAVQLMRIFPEVAKLAREELASDAETT